MPPSKQEEEYSSAHFIDLLSLVYVSSVISCVLHKQLKVN